MVQKEIIWPFFLIALFFVVTSPISVIAFAPFLVISYYRYSFFGSLWVSAGCGLIVDVLASTPFGMNAMNYCGVTCFLFRYRIYFVNTPIGMAALTFVFSILSSVATTVLSSFIAISFPFSLMGILTDFFLMSLLDGVYSLVCFSFPLFLYRLIRRQWFRFLFFREEIKKKKETNA